MRGLPRIAALRLLPPAHAWESSRKRIKLCYARLTGSHWCMSVDVSVTLWLPHWRAGFVTMLLWRMLGSVPVGHTYRPFLAVSSFLRALPYLSTGLSSLLRNTVRCACVPQPKPNDSAFIAWVTIGGKGCTLHFFTDTWIVAILVVGWLRWLNGRRTAGWCRWCHLAPTHAGWRWLLFFFFFRVVYFVCALFVCSLSVI